MGIKVYEYKKCSTCVKATKFLDSRKVTYEALPIIETPPSMAELKKMLGYLKSDGETFKKLFNTSGEMYRNLKMSDKLKAGMSEDEALTLLAKNGKLIKRPFLLTDNGGTVGFDEAAWKKLV